MNTPSLKVDVDNGKYTVIQEADGRLRALRHGEPWRDCVGDKLILALAFELNELRDEIANREKVQQEQLKMLLVGDDKMKELEATLKEILSVMTTCTDWHTAAKIVAICESNLREIFNDTIETLELTIRSARR